jgi:hypothetical protein
MHSLRQAGDRSRDFREGVLIVIVRSLLPKSRAGSNDPARPR